MKRLAPRVLPAFFGMVAGLALAVILNALSDGTFLSKLSGTDGAGSAHVDTNSSEAELTKLGFEVLEYIKDRDYSALSRAAHPEYGVIFSPYATISLTSDKCFRPKEISGFSDNTNLYVWGVYDGTGNPIELTPADYFERFVFDKDFSSASIIGINTIVRTGNALENISEVFPDVRYIDFHVPGGDKDTPEELDWSSLRLGFEEYDGELRLTLILHSEWTV